MDNAHIPMQCVQNGELYNIVKNLPQPIQINIQNELKNVDPKPLEVVSHQDHVEVCYNIIDDNDGDILINSSPTIPSILNSHGDILEQHYCCSQNLSDDVIRKNSNVGQNSSPLRKGGVVALPGPPNRHTTPKKDQILYNQNNNNNNHNFEQNFVFSPTSLNQLKFNTPQKSGSRPFINNESSLIQKSLQDENSTPQIQCIVSNNSNNTSNSNSSTKRDSNNQNDENFQSGSEKSEKKDGNYQNLNNLPLDAENQYIMTFSLDDGSDSEHCQGLSSLIGLDNNNQNNNQNNNLNNLNNNPNCQNNRRSNSSNSVGNHNFFEQNYHRFVQPRTQNEIQYSSHLPMIPSNDNTPDLLRSDLDAKLLHSRKSGPISPKNATKKTFDFLPENENLEIFESENNTFNENNQGISLLPTPTSSIGSASKYSYQVPNITPQVPNGAGKVNTNNSKNNQQHLDTDMRINNIDTISLSSGRSCKLTPGFEPVIPNILPLPLKLDKKDSIELNENNNKNNFENNFEIIIQPPLRNPLGPKPPVLPKLFSTIPETNNDSISNFYSKQINKNPNFGSKNDTNINDTNAHTYFQDLPRLCVTSLTPRCAIIGSPIKLPVFSPLNSKNQFNKNDQKIEKIEKNEKNNSSPLAPANSVDPPQNLLHLDQQNLIVPNSALNNSQSSTTFVAQNTSKNDTIHHDNAQPGVSSPSLTPNDSVKITKGQFTNGSYYYQKNARNNAHYSSALSIASYVTQTQYLLEDGTPVWVPNWLPNSNAVGPEKADLNLSMSNFSISSQHIKNLKNANEDFHRRNSNTVNSYIGRNGVVCDFNRGKQSRGDSEGNNSGNLMKIATTGPPESKTDESEPTQSNSFDSYPDSMPNGIFDEKIQDTIIFEQNGGKNQNNLLHLRNLGQYSPINAPNTRPFHPILTPNPGLSPGFDFQNNVNQPDQPNQPNQQNQHNGILSTNPLPKQKIANHNEKNDDHNLLDNNFNQNSGSIHRYPQIPPLSDNMNKFDPRNNQSYDSKGNLKSNQSWKIHNRIPPNIINQQNNYQNNNGSQNNNNSGQSVSSQSFNVLSIASNQSNRDSNPQGGNIEENVITYHNNQFDVMKLRQEQYDQKGVQILQNSHNSPNFQSTFPQSDHNNPNPPHPFPLPLAINTTPPVPPQKDSYKTSSLPQCVDDDGEIIYIPKNDQNNHHNLLNHQRNITTTTITTTPTTTTEYTHFYQPLPIPPQCPQHDLNEFNTSPQSNQDGIVNPNNIVGYHTNPQMITWDDDVESVMSDKNSIGGMSLDTVHKYQHHAQNQARTSVQLRVSVQNKHGEVGPGVGNSIGGSNDSGGNKNGCLNQNFNNGKIIEINDPSSNPRCDNPFDEEKIILQQQQQQLQQVGNDQNNEKNDFLFSKNSFFQSPLTFSSMPIPTILKDYISGSNNNDIGYSPGAPNQSIMDYFSSVATALTTTVTGLLSTELTEESQIEIQNEAQQTVQNQIMNFSNKIGLIVPTKSPFNLNKYITMDWRGKFLMLIGFINDLERSRRKDINNGHDSYGGQLDDNYHHYYHKYDLKCQCDVLEMEIIVVNEWIDMMYPNPINQCCLSENHQNDPNFDQDYETDQDDEESWPDIPPIPANLSSNDDQNGKKKQEELSYNFLTRFFQDQNDQNIKNNEENKNTNNNSVNISIIQFKYIPKNALHYHLMSFPQLKLYVLELSSQLTEKRKQFKTKSSIFRTEFEKEFQINKNVTNTKKA